MPEVEEFDGYPEDIRANTILVMVDVDSTTMDTQLNWPSSVQTHYRQFVRGLAKKTKRRIHAYTTGDTDDESWNTRGWEWVEWAENYKKGILSDELVDAVKKKGGGKLDIVVFGAMWSDCVEKVAKGLSKVFPKVYAWREYSMDEATDGTYFVSGDEYYDSPDGKVTILEAKEARDIAFKILKEAGIEDAITVKVRPFTGDKEKWIALYRGLSQFRGRPIIWLNEELDDLMDEYDVPEDRRFDILVDGKSVV